MIDFSDPATQNLRLSHAEREDAVGALDEFAREGRLTADEASERSSAVRAALTRGELKPLFADLPVSTGRASSGRWADANPATGRIAEPAASAGFGSSGDHDRPLRSWKYALAAVAPFVAVALFFITGTIWGYAMAWLWFLLIPVAGILAYGASGWGYRGRDH